MKSKTALITLFAQALALVTVPASIARAQDPPPPSGGGAANEGNEGEELPNGPGPTVIQVPSMGGAGYPGSLPPPGFDPNAHLPSSSRSTTDVSRSSDGFDLLPRSEGGGSIRGSAGGSVVLEGRGQPPPEGHTVRRGDTLWDLSNRYYQNPYQWPRVWAHNPQIQNPHWIYPGDRIRLREPADASSPPTLGSVGQAQAGPRVEQQTVFLRDVGWIDDKKEDTWGELVGSPEDKMLLSYGDDVYLKLEDGHDAQVGDKLTIFRPIRTIVGKDAEGKSAKKGELVSIRGTARIDRYNPKTRMVRARVIESIDVIERGAKVGPVVRKLDKGVRPSQSDKDLEARILASIYPYQLYGQHQVVFIDKGEKDGVKLGQRFFAVRRGDRWAQNIGSAGSMAVKRPRVEDDRPAQVDGMRFGVDEDLLPDETYAELRVVRMRDHTATALVVSSRHEVERTAHLVARKGL
jgi:LysM repeat protein